MDLPGVQSLRNMELNKSQSPVSHLAIDIGGTLIKLVYFSSSIESPSPREKKDQAGMNESLGVSSGDRRHPVLEGKLRFAKFETSKINDCIEFISSKALHLGGFPLHKAYLKEKILVKATGGGAYKFAELFNEKLGIVLDKEDEMDCLVAGANFLLKAVHQEAFTYLDGKREFAQIDTNDMYPYLLVNIGSGVSMIKVDGDDKFERVSGTSVGGGTFLGLAKLLTKCKSFDELLELSHQGNNIVIDMLVGDIYGGNDYTKIGLSSTTIASSFGKVIPDKKELEDYKREDLARSLLRMISNNIGQLAYLTALRFGLKRIFFGGFFIRGHAYTMETISVAVNFWSKGEAKAMFLRHEGFLGGLGAFTSYEKHSLDGMIVHHLPLRSPIGMFCAGNTFSYIPSGEVNDSECIECSVYAT